jgi:hypothetical protein
MNIFLLGCSTGEPIDLAPAYAALHELRMSAPILRQCERERWVSPRGNVAAAVLVHPATRIGPIRYTAFRLDEMAMFAGRPFRWTDDVNADGRSVLDPEFYLAPPTQWEEQLDGRCVVVRWRKDADVVDVYTDLMGSYPVFWAHVGRERWISNSASLLCFLRGSWTARPSSIAQVIGCDHSLDGESWWEGIHRLPRAALCRFHRQDIEIRERFPFSEIATLFGHGFDGRRAAQSIVAAVRACADWPERPSVLPITAGRDSRIIFAAAIQAGIDFRAMSVALPFSPPWPDPEDVRVGREISRIYRVQHAANCITPDVPILADPVATSKMLKFLAPLPVSDYDLMTIPSSLPEGPLEILHMGLGGEFARARFGLGEGLDEAALVNHLTRIVMPTAARALLSQDGARVVTDAVASDVRAYLDSGIAETDVPDVFYLNNHMAPWGGAVQSAHDCVQDTTSAMWAARMLREHYGAHANSRQQHVFLREVLTQLMPSLLDYPFQGDPFGAHRRPRRERLKHLSGVFADELRLRRPISDPAWRKRSPIDVFNTYLGHVREQVHSNSTHPAWQVLNRPNVLRLMARPAALYDRRSRTFAWRLGTVFGTP